MQVQIIPLSSNNFSQVVREQSSDMPSLDTLLWQDLKCTEDTMMHRIAAISEDGRMVGFGLAVSGPWDPILQPGYFEISINVERECRKQGIGNKIYQELEQFAIKHQAIALQGSVRESSPEDLAWTDKRGFRIEQHTFESSLDLSNFNPRAFDDVLSLHSGLYFSSFSNFPQNDEWFERFVKFWWELAKDAPGMEGKPRPKLEQMKKLFENVEPEGSILIVDGEKWVALSLVIRETENIYYNNLTGVCRPYRGNGLSLAAKVKVAEFAKDQGAKYLRTHNDSNNEPILAVNRRMGYESKPGMYTLTRSMHLK
jgi:GNAT superfamily N-acetyltransferase